MRTPHGFHAADTLVEQVVQHELALRALDGELAAVLAPLADAVAVAKRHHANARQPHLDFIADALPALARWYGLNLKRYGRGRTIELPSGTLEGRLSGHWKVTVSGDVDEVIRAVADRDPAGIKVDVDLNIAEIAANPSRYAGIKGLEFSMDDNLRVRSPLLYVPIPKALRLTVLLRRYLDPRRKPRTIKVP